MPGISLFFQRMKIDVPCRDLNTDTGFFEVGFVDADGDRSWRRLRVTEGKIQIQKSLEANALLDWLARA